MGWRDNSWYCYSHVIGLLHDLYTKQVWKVILICEVKCFGFYVYKPLSMGSHRGKSRTDSCIPRWRDFKLFQFHFNLIPRYHNRSVDTHLRFQLCRHEGAGYHRQPRFSVNKTKYFRLRLSDEVWAREWADRELRHQRELRENYRELLEYISQNDRGWVFKTTFITVTDRDSHSLSSWRSRKWIVEYCSPGKLCHLTHTRGHSGQREVTRRGNNSESAWWNNPHTSIDLTQFVYWTYIHR